MKLGTKLTLYLSLIIVLVLSGYGYLDILSRRDALVGKMKAEVRSTGQTLRASLDQISLPDEMEYVQGLIDAVCEYERTSGVIVFYQQENLIFYSHASKEGAEPYLKLIRRSIRENRPEETYGTYKEAPVFSYTFPLQNREGKNIGGVSILQSTSFMEGNIKRAKWSILIATLLLIGGTVALILAATRTWLTHPISRLMEGIDHLSKGDLDYQIHLKGRNELSHLAIAFNRMAVDLKEARERIIREAETKLELERNLRRSEKLATVGQLASGLAHEIGTPLNIIYGRTEMVKRRVEDDEIKKYLDTVLHQTERITRIIQQLLGFVRKKKPEQKALDIRIILENTVDLLDHQIRKQRVRVTKDLRDGLPAVIGDPDQLQQVFLNLILNAIQSMPEGGTIRLSASPRRTSKGGLEGVHRLYLEIDVEDTGAGIESEVIQDIFNPFFTTKDTGTGLGLMVTQGIVQDHEGWIDVKSAVRKGSVFKVFLPCLEGEAKADEQES